MYGILDWSDSSIANRAWFTESRIHHNIIAFCSMYQQSAQVVQILPSHMAQVVERVRVLFCYSSCIAICCLLLLLSFALFAVSDGRKLTAHLGQTSNGDDANTRSRTSALQVDMRCRYATAVFHHNYGDYTSAIRSFHFEQRLWRGLLTIRSFPAHDVSIVLVCMPAQVHWSSLSQASKQCPQR